MFSKSAQTVQTLLTINEIQVLRDSVGLCSIHNLKLRLAHLRDVSVIKKICEYCYAFNLDVITELVAITF